MALQRIELIVRAKDRAGRSAVPLNLAQVFDELLIDEISLKYPVLKNQLLSGTTVDDQAYQSESFPPNYRFDENNERMYCDDTLIDRIELGAYFYKIETDETTTAQVPSKYAIDSDNSKIYFWPTPDDAYAYKFYHTIIHPKAGRSRSFTSGGTVETRPGDTVTGATGGATGVVSFVKVTSGTWAAGTAAGTLYFSSQTGTFTSENLNIGASLNVATIAGDSSNEDAFEHLLGSGFDTTLIYGLVAKACELTDPPQFEKSLFWGDRFQNDLLSKVVSKSGKAPVMQANFWRPGMGRWSRR